MKRDRILSSTLSLLKAKLRKTLAIPIFLALLLLLDLFLEVKFKLKVYLDFLLTLFMKLLLVFGLGLTIVVPCPIDSRKLCIRQLDFSCWIRFIFPSTYNIAHVNISFLVFML